jgi:hypothetical protein
MSSTLSYIVAVTKFGN